MFPRELWNIIYHYSILKTLKILRLINKQFNGELLDTRFWQLYTKKILIDQRVTCNNGLEWIKECHYINYINKLIDQLSKSFCCQQVIKSGIYKGIICNKKYCNHQDIHGSINKGSIVIYLKNINIDHIDFFMGLNNDKYEKCVIYNSRFISIETNGVQNFSKIISIESFKLLIYQIYKQIKI